MPAAAQWTQWGGPNGDFSVDATGITDATELVEIGETVLDASSAADAIQRVQTIAIRIAENRVGAEAKELDAFIPKPRTRAGAGQ